MCLFRYINLAWKIRKDLKQQKEFNNSFLLPYLDELEIKFNGKFSNEQRYKIINYYGLYITIFLCSNFKRMSGKELNDEERKRATLFGILTPVYDDLFDVDKLDLESIKEITINPENFKAVSFSSGVAKKIQSYQIKNVPNREEYLRASINVLDIQIETMKQTNKNISKSELQRITFEKGAASVIIYYQVLDDAADEQLLEVLYLIGSLYQLGNDIFDLYKDVRDNIFTLVNTCEDFSELKQTFHNRIILQNQKIMALPFRIEAKKEFCLIINSINARSMVALNQLIRYQKSRGKKIDWWKTERKDMICDMEKPINIIRWLYYIWKLPRMLKSI